MYAAAYFPVMMKHSTVFSVCLFITACSSVPAVQPLDPREGGMLDTQKNLTEYVESSVGLSVRYPKTVSFSEACEDLEVTASENDGDIEFSTLSSPDECAPAFGRMFASIQAQRVEDEIDVRDFIGRVFSPDCLIVEKSTFVKNGDETDILFTEHRNPPVDGPDFTCRTVQWNKSAGIVWYSDLADKTGGAYDWPSRIAIKTEGGWENGWDFFIVDSIRFKR